MAPLYARYIPPKKPQDAVKSTQKISQPVVDISPSNGPSIADAGDGRKKRKRTDEERAARKSRKQAKKGDIDASTDDTGTGPSVADAELHQRREIDSKIERNGDTIGTTTVTDRTSEPDRSMRKYQNVLNKFQKSARRAAVADRHDDSLPNIEEPKELHDLVPLPQPEREKTPEFRQTYSTLPEWLEKPISVSSTTTTSFQSLGIEKRTEAHLKSKGFPEAFAVQTALLPRLVTPLDGLHRRPNDLCVAAPTGSGKTLGYVLPIVENLRRRQMVRRLRAIVVVPTRELVNQALTTFKLCAAGSQLQVATSTGNQGFTEEQAALIHKTSRFDPKLYEQNLRRVRHRQMFEDDSEDDGGDDLDDVKGEQYLKDAVTMPPYHVPLYQSAVDVLICTPGRLVEHLQNTVGFTLDDLEYLVIDEADRLLDQSFQDWVKVINGALEPKVERLKARYVRKVILSATMTRDVSQLSALRLQRPSLIVVKGDTLGDDAVKMNDRGDFELPAGLKEHAIPVGDGSEKPLHLLGLVEQLLLRQNGKIKRPRDNSSDSSSSDSSEVSSESSDSSSESDTDTVSSSSVSTSGHTAHHSPGQPRSPGAAAQILIFAASTSEAHRLHHLLQSLLPQVTKPVPALTLLTRSQTNLSSLVSSHPDKARMIISTDRASRGLDLALTHVINYTIPRSLESYVHRVGRTARAGRGGEAWSLFTDKEGRWFWNEIARAEQVARRTGVDRRKVEGGTHWTTDEGKAQYQRILAEMAEMVDGEKKDR
ncbi:hypothetical protein CAC42_7649 [Sphaceloma murrayae]|uniref:ATP-dependent RNA helicase n=1 Tax=Sphaceloma murrayae TaxID=2082308 RepID=A0A2K1QTK9_9PEZI|nr:hypothetical protein CAC42_7649 [Sphaceloma murrayae]